MLNKGLEWLEKWMISPKFLFLLVSVSVFWICFNISSPNRFDVGFAFLDALLGIFTCIQTTVIAIVQKNQKKVELKNKETNLISEKAQKQEEIKQKIYMIHLMESIVSILKEGCKK